MTQPINVDRYVPVDLWIQDAKRDGFEPLMLLSARRDRAGKITGFRFHTLPQLIPHRLPELLRSIADDLTS